jgi:hypothetical protein
VAVIDQGPEAIGVAGNGLPCDSDVPVTARFPRLTSVVVLVPVAEQRKMSPAMVDVGGGVFPHVPTGKVRRTPE